MPGTGGGRSERSVADFRERRHTKRASKEKEIAVRWGSRLTGFTDDHCRICRARFWSVPDLGGIHMSPTVESKTAIFRRMLSQPSWAGLYRHSVAWFLGALVVLFVIAPLIEVLPNGRLLSSAAVSVTMVAAVLAVGGRRASLVLAAILAIPVLIGWWLEHHRSEGFAFLWFMIAFLLFLTFVIAQFFRFILRAPKVDSEVLCAGISIYLLLALWWTCAYTLTARLVPGSFGGLPASNPNLEGFEALYFSLVTLTTVGFGDVTPLSRPARMLAMVEALTGTLYMAVLVSRLVSLHTSLTSPPPPADSR